MILINLNVKESAYDKIIYFLSHLKDDVKIITSSKKSDNLSRNKDIDNIDTFFNTLRDRHIRIDKDINIV
jgi:hypothetical protein